MEEQELQVMYVWFVASVAFMLLEALGAPGIGLLFAGIGALAAGAAVYGGYVHEDAFTTQFAIFFAGSAVSALLLWKPMQKKREGRKAAGFRNMIGDTAFVLSGGINQEEGGNVQWSGTIMKAELMPEYQGNPLAEGDKVVIVEVHGATLVVRPK